MKFYNRELTITDIHFYNDINDTVEISYELSLEGDNIASLLEGKFNLSRSNYNKINNDLENNILKLIYKENEVKNV